MSSLKHTQGPWILSVGIGSVHAPNGEPIQTGGLACSEESQANARLIAAAPELLESLKSCVQDIERLTAYIKENVPAYREDNQDDNALIVFEPSHAYAAIAKAETVKEATK